MLWALTKFTGIIAWSKEQNLEQHPYVVSMLFKQSLWKILRFIKSQKLLKNFETEIFFNLKRRTECFMNFAIEQWEFCMFIPLIYSNKV